MVRQYTVQLALDKRTQKRDGSYPIKFRITLNRKSVYVSTKFSVAEEHWHPHRKEIKAAARGKIKVNETNNRLQKERLKIVDAIDNLHDSGRLETMSVRDIKAHILGKGEIHNLYAYFEKIIDQLLEADKIGNARVYRTTLLSIQNYMGEKDFPMKFITYAWLTDYETWYLSKVHKTIKGKDKKNTLNGLSVHMRTLRALLNRAIKSGHLPQNNYPFKQYKIASKGTRKRAITAQDILKIKQLPDDQLTPRQKRAKTYFLMSFYLMGISFIDLAFLAIENIVQDRIIYTRRKTGREHSIKITKGLWELMAPFLKGKGDDDYILDIIKGETTQEKYDNVRDEMQRYNRALKHLANLAGIDEHVSSYTVRHSYATIAKNNGVPISVISEALGHESLETTQVYLKSFDAHVLDEYNTFIIDKAMNEPNNNE